ncbi:SusD/RagB family nutrient-binding outer membrane lipoprotein [Fulvivirga sediminis]|uniref:SusD/RagB family nutrient-binding outer membrane lipoprotein n=1 Tax=Fulvivirga sediminis TaxID=2803949 RepID=A0A937K251_9BACT|nr:SusD/RagB family nutrient-binding outer membrane lipoprotein [Fulvivirga sediminis]MBL3658000.1 SusD/RagB family nutrient-binding outer membrane lipoprotein [Fulvivirga sediminis]
MKNLYIKTIVVFLLGQLLVSSCNDFLDVNKDPTKVKAEDVNLEALLPTVLEATSESHYEAMNAASCATHQIDQYFGYYTEFTLTSNWSRAYLECLNTLSVMEEKATEKEAPHYLGIVRILQALNLGLVTDTWEDAPLAEALAGSNNITPAYDTQQKIYQAIFDYLSEAEEYLKVQESTYPPDNDDMIYGGDLKKWENLLHALKARYMLHLYHKGQFTASDILSEVDLGFTSNEDNFQLAYNEVNLNPLHSDVALANETGNFTVTHGKYFVDLLNGAIYSVVDPRLPIIADKGASTEYHGLASYDPSTPASTTDLTRDTWYAKENSPIIMMSYSELKFIEAEMALETDPARANKAYLEGITAHMNMLEVEGSEIEDYLNNPSVDLGLSIDLEHIMKEKYIALFLNFEVWNDMRRLKYDPKIFRGFEEPDYGGRSEPAARALYPVSEQNRNATNLSSHIREFTQAMWKDLD